jgi:hypothetical protein
MIDISLNYFFHDFLYLDNFLHDSGHRNYFLDNSLNFDDPGNFYQFFNYLFNDKWSRYKLVPDSLHRYKNLFDYLFGVFLLYDLNKWFLDLNNFLLIEYDRDFYSHGLSNKLMLSLNHRLFSVLFLNPHFFVNKGDFDNSIHCDWHLLQYWLGHFLHNSILDY